jgi:methionine-rich copper-binding protein CopC
MKTYLTIYQGEQRAVELAIRDHNDAQYEPTNVYAKVVDESGNIVQAEADALLVSNVATLLITSTTSANQGDYEIVWRITKTQGDVTYTYYHKTQLVIEEL